MRFSHEVIQLLNLRYCFTCLHRVTWNVKNCSTGTLLFYREVRGVFGKRKNEESLGIVGTIQLPVLVILHLEVFVSLTTLNDPAVDT